MNASNTLPVTNLVKPVFYDPTGKRKLLVGLFLGIIGFFFISTYLAFASRLLWEPTPSTPRPLDVAISNNHNNSSVAIKDADQNQVFYSSTN